MQNLYVLFCQTIKITSCKPSASPPLYIMFYHLVRWIFYFFSGLCQQIDLSFEWISHLNIGLSFKWLSCLNIGLSFEWLCRLNSGLSFEWLGHLRCVNTELQCVLCLQLFATSLVPAVRVAQCSFHQTCGQTSRELAFLFVFTPLLLRFSFLFLFFEKQVGDKLIKSCREDCTRIQECVCVYISVCLPPFF